ncbi:unnamed protein product [Lota lota]
MTSEKVPIASAGPEDLQQFMPPAYSSVPVKPAGTGRLLKAGIAVLIAGAILLLFGAIGAFYVWNNNERHVYNVHYSMSVNGKVEEGSMEIDAVNNMERFRTGSGVDEAVEVHDFQIGITGIRFAGLEKCYIKTQVKARLPDVDTLSKDSMTLDLEDEVMPAKFEEDSLIWIAGDTPLADSAFLSNKIKDLCGDLPIFWLRPTYTSASQQKQQRRRQRRRRRGRAHFPKTKHTSTPVRARPQNATAPLLHLSSSSSSSPSPPQTGEEGTMTFDPMLDHQGICCAECRRPYSLCQRVCEPLGGYEPWPYHYRGCRVVCRAIMPCTWWMARILGIV